MSKCFFSGQEAKVVSLSDHDGISVRVEPFGEYWLTGMVSRCYTSTNALSDLEKLNCLKETINLNRDGLIPFWTVKKEGETLPNNPNIVLRSVEEVKARAIDHRDKDKKILNALSGKLTNSLNPFKFEFLNLADRYSLGIFHSDDYLEWVTHLVKVGFLELSEEGMSLIGDSQLKSNLTDLIENYPSMKFTVTGWDHLRSLSSGFMSRNVFVAMAFTDEGGRPTSAGLRDTLRRTLESLNWKPNIVDEVGHNDGIMDKVIALINESRFVVAELTYQKSGVYYEAGYAKGKGLSVIHIVKESDLALCHFDVKHLNIIAWKNLEDLASKLENRIKATIV